MAHLPGDSVRLDRGVGQRQEAYSRYGHSANRKGTGVATFRALTEKYPEKNPKDILDNLIRSSPDSEGKCSHPKPGNLKFHGYAAAMNTAIEFSMQALDVLD